MEYKGYTVIVTSLNGLLKHDLSKGKCWFMNNPIVQRAWSQDLWQKSYVFDLFFITENANQTTGVLLPWTPGWYAVLQ